MQNKLNKHKENLGFVVDVIVSQQVQEPSPRGSPHCGDRTARALVFGLAVLQPGRALNQWPGEEWLPTIVLFTIVGNNVW